MVLFCTLILGSACLAPSADDWECGTFDTVCMCRHDLPSEYSRAESCEMMPGGCCLANEERCFCQLVTPSANPEDLGKPLDCSRVRLADYIPVSSCGSHVAALLSK